MANQRRGYDAELRCAELMSDHGFIVFRSAASKGPFDIIAMGDGGTYLIQVKRTKEAARRRFPSVAKELRGIKTHQMMHKQIWCWVDRRGWYITDVHEDGVVERWMDGLLDYQSFAKVGGFKVPQESLGFSAEMLQ